MAVVRERVFEARDRQARIVGVARLERAPARDARRKRAAPASSSSTRAKGKWARNDAWPKRGSPSAQRPASSRGVPALVELPLRHRPLDHAGDLLRPSDRDRGEESGLVLDVRLVADRDVGEARPEPSRQIIPAPMPPMGKAIWSRCSPLKAASGSRRAPGAGAEAPAAPLIEAAAAIAPRAPTEFRTNSRRPISLSGIGWAFFLGRRPFRSWRPEGNRPLKRGNGRLAGHGLVGLAHR